MDHATHATRGISESPAKAAIRASEQELTEGLARAVHDAVMDDVPGGNIFPDAIDRAREKEKLRLLGLRGLKRAGGS